VDKLFKGKFNFETVLSFQKCVFGKVGLGFNPQSKKSGVSKPFSTFFEKQPIEKSKQPVVSCFYYMKMATLSDSTELGSFVFPKVFLNGYLRIQEF